MVVGSEGRHRRLVCRRGGRERGGKQEAGKKGEFIAQKIRQVKDAP